MYGDRTAPPGIYVARYSLAFRLYEGTHQERVSNAFISAFLSLLVLELGGVVILTPSQPGRRRLRPPSGHRLTAH